MSPRTFFLDAAFGLAAGLDATLDATLALGAALTLDAGFLAATFVYA